MFDRFTARARQTIMLAREEAKRLGHAEISNEHLLLGMLSQQECIAVKALVAMNIDLDAVRGQIEEGIGTGQASPGDYVAFADHPKRMFELALREALQLGHGYVGTEHLLLGIMRQYEGVAAEVLTGSGVDLNQARQAVLRSLGYSPDAKYSTAE